MDAPILISFHWTSSFMFTHMLLIGSWGYVGVKPYQKILWNNCLCITVA
jgi:hypothetical protein